MSPRFTIRPPSDAEVPACYALVPEIFRHDAAPELLAAVDQDNGAVLGALAVGWHLTGTPPAFMMWMQVTEVTRRHGIGRALVQATAELCGGETEYLRLWRKLPEGHAAEPFLAGCGFTPGLRALHFEASTQIWHDALAGLRDTLDRLGRGQDCRIVQLREAPLLAVARLLDRAFPAPRSDLLAALEGRAAVSYDPDLSVVALTGSREKPEVIGAAVGRSVGDASMGDLWAVDPAWRYSGVGVRLMAEAARLAIDAGLVRFRFFCDETVKETLSLARRSQAELRFIERYWELRLTA